MNLVIFDCKKGVDVQLPKIYVFRNIMRIKSNCWKMKPRLNKHHLSYYWWIEKTSLILFFLFFLSSHVYCQVVYCHMLHKSDEMQVQRKSCFRTSNKKINSVWITHIFYKTVERKLFQNVTLVQDTIEQQVYDSARSGTTCFIAMGGLGFKNLNIVEK